MEIRESAVIVTGAARGIGRGIAAAFAGEGAKVVLSDWGRLPKKGRGIGITRSLANLTWRKPNAKSARRAEHAGR